MKVNAMAFSDLMHALVYGGGTAQQLSERTGIHYVTMLEYLRQLHKRRVIVISGWRKDINGHGLTRVWTIRSAFRTEDEPRPKAKSRAEIAAAYRQRKLKELRNAA